MEKTRVGILFGGKSAEHEVSLQSAKNVYEALDRQRYEPVLIGIDKQGRWFLHDLHGDGFLPSAQSGAAALVPASKGDLTVAASSVVPVPLPKLDVIFPVLHGPFGEDGTVQGLLKLAEIPFVGPSVLGSAVGMDKDVMKRLLRDAGLPIGKFISLRSHEKLPPFDTVAKQIGVPFFVKPANMGSSVGIHKVHNEAEYPTAVADAFQFDTKIVMEEFIQGRELECAVLGNEEPAASVPGEVISSHEFYSYEAKYIDEKGAVLHIPAKLPAETTKRVQELAVQTFVALCCEGLSRVDFFLRDNGDILINEINTLPGFTAISMYPKLWEASGVPYTELVTKLIEFAIERFAKEQKLKTSVA